jgi:hypothetical protein
MLVFDRFQPVVGLVVHGDVDMANHIPCSVPTYFCSVVSLFVLLHSGRTCLDAGAAVIRPRTDHPRSAPQLGADAAVPPSHVSWPRNSRIRGHRELKWCDRAHLGPPRTETVPLHGPVPRRTQSPPGVRRREQSSSLRPNAVRAIRLRDVESRAETHSGESPRLQSWVALRSGVRPTVD